ncbi:protoporphyrinogen oxidase [Colletotrichum spaethianum]|uniref:Protoporphyrinogen oxidase n=1 Tax=Colletotrichum spaethianum TaxID=700344 RepID=A0AA37P4Y1_9PEZI|nr:protoporphyrinogen oxidase [Colletotrichum spaethianum]GKT42366.1 protoporphyrinogen oxidase [Colletotrichum spaethianum]
MALRRADNAFMALLRSYHSQRFCRAATHGAGAGILTRARFSTSALARRQEAPGSSPDAAPTLTNETKVPKEVAIIGGGITGLTAAHYLAKLLPETSNITVYEAANRLGGWIHTQEVEVEVNGQKNIVRFERGPRTLRGMGKDTWKFDDFVLFDLMRDLDMQSEYLGIKSPPRYIYYPDHLVTMHPKNVFSEAAFKGVIPGFLTLLWRRAKARNEPVPADMSVGDFIRFATGRPELTDNLASAMIHGIWGGDADRLSMRSFMPGPWWRFFQKGERDDWVTIPRNETGVLETLAKDQELQSYARAAQKDQLVFFKKGLSSLPNAVEKGLRQRKNVTFKLGEPVTNLAYDRKADQISLSTKNSKSPAKFDKVISTTTSNTLAAATNSALPSLARSPNVSIMAVNLWYPQPGLNASHPGVGYLVPRAVDSNPEGLLGVFFDSDVVPRAPSEPEGTKFFVLMGGHYWDEYASYPTEEEGIEMAKSVLERHLGIPKTQPAFAMARLAKDCIPQHHVGHGDRMARAADELYAAYGGKLAVAGGSYTSIGVTGGIRAGYDVAAAVAQSPQSHVGDTGLAQFRSHQTDLFQVPRAHLRSIGRDIEEKIGWRNYLR